MNLVHAVFVLFVLAVTAWQQQSAADQVAFPPAAAVTKARDDVANLYAERIAKANKSSEKVALGYELLKVAGEPGNEPAIQYALFCEVRSLAVSAKDWGMVSVATAAIVDRFSARGPVNRAEQIQCGDAFCEAAKKADTPARLAMQLEAAEWYTRAKGDGKGFQGQAAEKRLAELGEAVGAIKKKAGKDDDLKLLIGTWDVRVGKGRALWTFFADGSFYVNGQRHGTWQASEREVRVSWIGNARTFETFHRPIARAVTGDSFDGIGIVAGTKID